MYGHIEPLNASPWRTPVPHFVPHAALPAGEAYEAWIDRTACVPTRDNAHDFFNGLMWLAWPTAKRTLNQLQARCIAERGVGARRGALRDAATLFDESGAVLLTRDAALVHAWRARDWAGLFVAGRARWQAARVLVFGHALLDKLRAPYKAVTAHTLWLDLPHDAPLPHVDTLLAAALPAALAQRAGAPLPLMGVPHWHAGNAQATFYDDARVFRPAPHTEGG